EVGQVGRIPFDAGERARLSDRVPNRERPDHEARREGGGPCPGPPAPGPSPEQKKEGEEGDCTERQVDLSGEGDGGQRGGCEPRASSFPRPQRQRKEHGRPAEQVARARLDSPIRRERKREAADK